MLLKICPLTLVVMQWVKKIPITNHELPCSTLSYPLRHLLRSFAVPSSQPFWCLLWLWNNLMTPFSSVGKRKIIPQSYCCRNRWFNTLLLCGVCLVWEPCQDNLTCGISIMMMRLFTIIPWALTFPGWEEHQSAGAQGEPFWRPDWRHQDNCDNWWDLRRILPGTWCKCGREEDGKCIFDPGQYLERGNLQFEFALCSSLDDQHQRFKGCRDRAEITIIYSPDMCLTVLQPTNPSFTHNAACSVLELSDIDIPCISCSGYSMLMNEFNSFCFEQKAK